MIKSIMTEVGAYESTEARDYPAGRIGGVSACSWG
jgi:hypothetical protein